MSTNPYQTLDDIWDLLLALVPDADTAMRLAENAGLHLDALDRPMPLADLLREIVTWSHWTAHMADLARAAMTRFPEHEPELLRVFGAYAANPPGLQSGPPTPEVEPGDLIAEGAGDDRDILTADMPDTGLPDDLIEPTGESLVGPGLELIGHDVETSDGGGSGWIGTETPRNGGGEEAAPAVSAANGGAPQERVESLRLDTAVPRSVTVGEAFQVAVAVRQVTSPVLGRDNLPVTDSGDLQVLWPAGAAYITLRTQISAPDCRTEGPDGDAFKLFAGRDSPVFLYHLTPEHAGSISIYVTIYQEQDRLGTAGVVTKARAGHRRPSTSRVAGEMEVTVSSLALAPQGSLAALEPLHDLFVELFGRDRDAPRILAEQAGLDVSLIPFSNISSDYLWNVLVEAHQRNAVAALVEQAIERKAERDADLRAALGRYEQLVIRDS